MALIPKNLVVDYITNAKLISCHTLFSPRGTNVSTSINNIISATQFQSTSTPPNQTLFEEAVVATVDCVTPGLKADTIGPYNTGKFYWQSNVFSVDDQIFESVCTINSGKLEIICSGLTTGKEQVALGRDLGTDNSVRLSYTTNPDSISLTIGGYAANHLQVFQNYINIPNYIQTNKTSTTVMFAPNLLSTVFTTATLNPTAAITIPAISNNYKSMFLCFCEIATSQGAKIRFQVGKTSTTFPASPSVYMNGMASTPFDYVTATEGFGLTTDNTGFPCSHLSTDTTDRLNGFIRIDVDNVISASGYTKYQVSGTTTVTNNGSRISCVSGYIDGNNISGQADLSVIGAVRLFASAGTITSGIFSVLVI